MTVLQAGAEVSVTITYLEMPVRPGFDAPDLPTDVRLERAIDPPVQFFLAMYDAVGRDYEWWQRVWQSKNDPQTLHDFVKHPKVGMWLAYRHGWPHGFFVLDHRTHGICDLAYFGLVHGAIGQGLGGALLKTACVKGWLHDDVAKMTVNTCTLDHPRALRLYQKVGFVPVRTTMHIHTLLRDRDPSCFPA